MKKTTSLLLCAILIMCGVWALVAKADPAVDGTKVFGDAGFDYVIQYPAGWLYYAQEHHTAVFIGKPGGESNLPSVMIKSILSAKAGGTLTDVEGVIGDLENQLKSTSEAAFYVPEPFTYAKDGLKLTGKQAVMEYTLKGEKFKEWAVIIPKAGGDAFYVWAFTAPLKVYDEYLPVAKAMLDSWVIK